MDIYREEILDHFKNPRNFGGLDDLERLVEERNASCGDRIKLGVTIKKGKVKEIRFEGEGCAISMASASMLTEMVKGKEIEEVKSLDEKKMLERLGIPISEARKKCATLGLSAWQKIKK